jgi:hypothetical protein
MAQWTDADFTFPTEGWAVIRQGEQGKPWAVGDEVTVVPINTGMLRSSIADGMLNFTLDGPPPPKPGWRQRLKHWWYWNRPTMHRGPCDHSDCEEW